MGAGFVDRNFRYVHVNEAMAAINGASVQEHIGRAVPEVIPALWAEIEPHYHRVLDAGEAVLNVEISGTTAAEPCRTRHWARTFYPIRDGDDIVGIGVLVTDITERKQAQQAHHELTRATVAALAATVETRDPYTAGHQRRVRAASRPRSRARWDSTTTPSAGSASPRTFMTSASSVFPSRFSLARAAETARARTDPGSLQGRSRDHGRCRAALAGGRHDSPTPRAHGRQRLPRRLGGRWHLRRRSHHRGR